MSIQNQEEETNEMFENLLDEYENKRKGLPNKYDEAYKKMRKWCKHYKWGFNKQKIPFPFIEKIIKTIADDEDILEEILDATYTSNDSKIEKILKKLGIDGPEELLEEIVGDTDYLDNLFGA